MVKKAYKVSGLRSVFASKVGAQRAVKDMVLGAAALGRKIKKPKIKSVSYRRKSHQGWMDY